MTPPKPGPVPGNPLTAYLQRYPGLHATGGIAVPGMARGYAFTIFDSRRGKEYPYSSTFLHCDPTDTTGYVYLPKRSLIVMKTPEGPSWVLADSYQSAFTGQEAIDQFLQKAESEAAERVAPASNPLELLKRWYARNVQNEKRYVPIFSDQQVMIYQATLDSGTIGSLLLVPDWNDALPSRLGAKAKPGGVLKRIDYLSEYEQVALDDLYPYVHKAERRKQKHH